MTYIQMILTTCQCQCEDLKEVNMTIDKLTGYFTQAFTLIWWIQNHTAVHMRRKEQISCDTSILIRVPLLWNPKKSLDIGLSEAMRFTHLIKKNPLESSVYLVCLNFSKLCTLILIWWAIIGLYHHASVVQQTLWFKLNIAVWSRNSRWAS